MIALLLITTMVRMASAGAEGPRSPEYVIKAAYLYNFAMFIEWPGDAFAGADAPLVIGVVGKDPFGGALERVVEGKRINKRRIQVVRVQSPQEGRTAHLLFFNVDERARMPEYISRLDGLPVLLVGEWDDVIRQGGTINFGRNDNKVSYDISLPAARRARLTVSSKLLHLARFVRN